MSTKREPRPYLNPYLAGTLLGIVLFLAFFTTGGGLGASGALSHIQTGIEKWFAPGHVDRVAYFADMAGGLRNSWDNSGVYMLVGTLLGDSPRGCGIDVRTSRSGRDRGSPTGSASSWPLPGAS